MTTRKPAEVFHPGVQIREELEARGWTEQKLVEKLGLDLVSAERLVDGETRVTPFLAEKLGQAFGQNAQFWLNLQKAYDDAG